MGSQFMTTGEKCSEIKISYHDAGGTIVTSFDFELDGVNHWVTIHSKNKPYIKLEREGRVKAV